MNVLDVIFGLRFHRPCLYLALAFALGIALGTLAVAWEVWAIVSGLLLSLALLTRLSTTTLMAIVALGGLCYQSAHRLPVNHVAFMTYEAQKSVRFAEGQVASDVETRMTPFGTKQTFELALSRVEGAQGAADTVGKVLVDYYAKTPLTYADQVRLEGKLYKASAQQTRGFNYRQYLADHGIYMNMAVKSAGTVDNLGRNQGHWLVKTALSVKHTFKRILASYLSPREAGVIQAMLLGDRSLLPKDIYTLFSQTGTAHILAISGMNMTIISAIVLFLLKTLRFSRRSQLILTALFLLAYAFLSGLSASVVRSVVMAVVLLMSFCLEEEADTLNSLGLAALVLLGWDPRNLFDTGFQLSFVSVAVLVIAHKRFWPLVEGLFQAKVLKYVAQAFLISIVAWVGLLGLIAAKFHMVTPIAILANIPIVVLADTIILLSLGVAVLGLICPPLAFVFAGTLKLAFNLMVVISSLFAQIPGAYIYIQEVKILHVSIYYLIAAIVYLVIDSRLPQRSNIKDL